MVSKSYGLFELPEPVGCGTEDVMDPSLFCNRVFLKGYTRALDEGKHFVQISLNCRVPVWVGGQQNSQNCWVPVWDADGTRRTIGYRYEELARLTDLSDTSSTRSNIPGILTAVP